ncbi:uncharacterized protein LOC118700976 [Molothrus ater]|uniref:uncharacterized protein LOC118700976 n=1 Tax=Molothrus ater TaxID=84834 RepID=UPI00174B0C17|nr:uncharacterized protein LOC118700976 [Molothrus ater]
MSWWRKPGGFRVSLLSGAVVLLAEKGVEAAIDAIRRWNREKTNKALESKIDKASQDLDNEMKALHEDFKKLQEIRAELEKIPDEEIAMELKSKLKKTARELSRRIQTLQEDVKKWRETIKDELCVCRAELEKIPGNKEEDIARVLESMLNKNHRLLSQRIQTLEADVEEWSEGTWDELQLRRPELENIRGNKMEQIAQALKSMLKNCHRLISQRTHTLEEDVQECLEATKDELRLRRA